jgi:hypothetical protein
VLASIAIFLVVAGILYGIFAYPRGGAAGLGHDLSMGCFTVLLTLVGLALVGGGLYLLVTIGGVIGAFGIALILLGGCLVKVMLEDTFTKRP